ncbi:MAG: AAA family ATPase, partial [Clostridiales bacterium]|nr:AAA family ATPase [Clostridiales bacterium]
MAKIISIVNQKGGVGKTTTAVNLSAAVGQMGYRVLLADIDPQGNSTSGFGVNKREISLSSYEIITSQAAIEDAILKTDCENVYILPSNMNLAGAEIEIIEVEKRESILKTALLKVSDKFDYIFID